MTDWNYIQDKLPTISMETVNGGLSTTKVVLLDDGTVTKANYYKTGMNTGWNISNMENKVIAWKDIVKNDTE